MRANLSAPGPIGSNRLPNPRIPPNRRFRQLVEGEGFEPSKAWPADLQSAPFDRSGTPPNETRNFGEKAGNCQTLPFWSPVNRRALANRADRPRESRIQRRRSRIDVRREAIQ